MIAFVVALIGILRALSLLQSTRSRNLLKDELEAKISFLSKDATEDIRKYYESEMDKRIDELNERIDKTIEENRNERNENLKEVQTQIEQAHDQIEKAENYLINVEFKELHEKNVAKASKEDGIEERTL